MKTGMMWAFDDPRKPLEVQVAIAAKYYYEKYGKAPETCRVHPSLLGGLAQVNVTFISVKPMKEILPNSLWMGCEEAKHG
jgi:hypothetical protein